MADSACLFPDEEKGSNFINSTKGIGLMKAKANTVADVIATNAIMSKICLYESLAMHASLNGWVWSQSALSW